jgi:hypothetical protein
MVAAIGIVFLRVELRTACAMIIYILWSRDANEEAEPYRLFDDAVQAGATVTPRGEARRDARQRLSENSAQQIALTEVLLNPITPRASRHQGPARTGRVSPRDTDAVDKVAMLPAVRPCVLRELFSYPRRRLKGQGCLGGVSSALAFRASSARLWRAAA